MGGPPVHPPVKSTEPVRCVNISLWTIMCLKSYFNARAKKYTAKSHEKDESDKREVCTTY